MDFTREFIEIGQIQIRYYGIIIVTAMLFATFVAVNLAKRTGRDPEHVYGALTWAIIPGIIGARLFFVLFPAESQVLAGFDRSWYFASTDNFFDLNNGAIAIWSGGLSIWGAVLGGLLGAYIYLRRNKLPVGPWLDIGGVVLPLGQAIGRWANFINRELYGTPTSLPWGLDIPTDERPEKYRAIEYFDSKFHPLFIYEAIWNIAAFFVLRRLYLKNRDRFLPGDFFLLYIMQYSVVRFLLEFIRVEVVKSGDINVWQAVSAVLFIITLAIYLYRHSRTQATTYPEPLPQEQPPKVEAAA